MFSSIHSAIASTVGANQMREADVMLGILEKPWILLTHLLGYVDVNFFDSEFLKDKCDFALIYLMHYRMKVLYSVHTQ